ncbi:plexin-B2b [Salvelinus namaycush]|uniref:Plexin-B2b n=1 Tax=Salvelinus namaycush TaxID=8040 RepID=A0A8U1FBC6_SALNM|nr:plexin-B2b [Salvelinus namaycush]
MEPQQFSHSHTDTFVHVLYLLLYLIFPSPSSHTDTFVHVLYLLLYLIFPSPSSHTDTFVHVLYLLLYLIFPSPSRHTDTFVHVLYLLLYLIFPSPSSHTDTFVHVLYLLLYLIFPSPSSHTDTFVHVLYLLLYLIFPSPSSHTDTFVHVLYLLLYLIFPSPSSHTDTFVHVLYLLLYLIFPSPSSHTDTFVHVLYLLLYLIFPSPSRHTDTFVHVLYLLYLIFPSPSSHTDTFVHVLYLLLYLIFPSPSSHTDTFVHVLYLLLYLIFPSPSSHTDTFVHVLYLLLYLIFPSPSRHTDTFVHVLYLLLYLIFPSPSSHTDTFVHVLYLLLYLIFPSPSSHTDTFVHVLYLLLYLIFPSPSRHTDTFVHVLYLLLYLIFPSPSRHTDTFVHVLYLLLYLIFPSPSSHTDTFVHVLYLLLYLIFPSPSSHTDTFVHVLYLLLYLIFPSPSSHTDTFVHVLYLLLYLIFPSPSSHTDTFVHVLYLLLYLIFPSPSSHTDTFVHVLYLLLYLIFPSPSSHTDTFVEINVPSLPSVGQADRLHCVFPSYMSDATMSSGQVTCALPSPDSLPSTPEQQDFVAVPIKIFVNESVELATREFKFYNCSATVRKAENTPCMSCVASPWGCQWNTQEHTCQDMDGTVLGPQIIKHRQGARCPQFENPDPVLIPVGFKTTISFEGINLDVYQDRTFTIGTELMRNLKDVRSEDGPFYSFSGFNFSFDKSQETNVLFYVKDKETGKKIDSTLNVTLYNCSLGREDCSLCKNAAPKYSCVWCAKRKSCVYEKLCIDQATEDPQDTECPDPQITDIIPRYGPVKGGISVTIKGSNLGIHKEDIKAVSVVGVPCIHQEDRYAVSTSVVCEIGPLDPLSTNWGPVEVELEGGKRGTSSVFFTYRDPIASSVHPDKGAKAGGMVITISGSNLDTATREDVTVTVGGVVCTVEAFGANITCRMGEYRADKVPSDLLMVTVKYGKNSTTAVPTAFQFWENPIILDHHPKGSFVCGGRTIVVTGSGFDLIQNAIMRVQASADEWSGMTPTEYLQEALNKNDTVLQFLSPAVNRSYDTQVFRTFIQLDNWVRELKPFDYHPNPAFNPLIKKIITETSIIIVTGRGFSKAMTAKEAQAFVGDIPYFVNTLQDDKLFLDPPSSQPWALSKRHRRRRDTSSDPLDLLIKFGNGEWVVGSVHYERKNEVSLLIIPAVIVPMLLIILISVYCYRRKSQQAEREYEKVKHQLENLEESVRDRCKKEFTDLMIEMEDHTNDLSEGRIPFLDYKTYTDRVFFLPSKDGANDVMITGKLDIPEARKAIVAQALNQFSNLLNSKTFLINFIKTLEGRPDFNARAKVYFASLLTVALHGKLEYYTDIMRTLLLELMGNYVDSKNPKLMLRRSETVVERMLCNWMSICLYQFLKDSAGEPLYKLFRAIKHQIEKGPVDARVKKAKYTLNDTGLLGDDVEYCVLTLQVLVHGEGPDVTPVKVLNCDTVSQVKEKIIEAVYRNLPYSQRPKVDSVTLEWRPGSTGQILSDLDLTSQKEGRWRRINTLAHYNVRDNATLVLSRVLHTQQNYDQNQDNQEERNSLLDDDKVFHLVRPDELDEMKSKRGSMKDKSMTKAITEIYLTRLLSVKGTLQQFVDDFFRSVLCSGAVVPPAIKYFFDFLDEQALKHENVDEETIHIWKTNSLPLRFWVNILKNPHFIFDVHVTEVVDASLSVIAQTFMDACTKSEHKLSRDSPSNKLLYAKEISTYKKMVDDYYKGIRQMVSVSDQDMNTHLAEVSRTHTDKLNIQVALYQLYQYASRYYDGIIQSLDEDPAAQSKQLTLRLQQIAAALENKVTDL